MGSQPNCSGPHHLKRCRIGGHPKRERNETEVGAMESKLADIVRPHVGAGAVFVSLSLKSFIFPLDSP